MRNKTRWEHLTSEQKKIAMIYIVIIGGYFLIIVYSIVAGLTTPVTNKVYYLQEGE